MVVSSLLLVARSSCSVEEHELIMEKMNDVVKENKKDSFYP